MSSLDILDSSVVGFIPSISAAPPLHIVEQGDPVHHQRTHASD
jgi:hypothetical protein